MLIINLNEPPSLLQNNVRGSNHWLKVILIGTSSNRSAIGAPVTAQYGDRRQSRAVLAQASFLYVNDRRLHYGLGAATMAKVEIRWPNGKSDALDKVPADQLVVIEESKGAVRTDRFVRRPSA